jgi:ribosomal protein L11 methyltransferase
MSFGSGYHETTAQMLTRLLGLDLKGKRVLDMGCGTGVLGILAALRGATDVQGIDIDEGACVNALENAALNGVTLRVDFGDVAVLERAEEPYDVVLANINRNILLADMAHYVAHLAAGGRLLMSGFYEEDFPAIQACAESLGLTLEDRGSRGGWVCCAFYNG